MNVVVNWVGQATGHGAGGNYILAEGVKNEFEVRKLQVAC